MRCPVCGHENDAKDSHCRECAAALRSAEDEILSAPSIGAFPSLTPVDEPLRESAEPPPVAPGFTDGDSSRRRDRPSPPPTPAPSRPPSAEKGRPRRTIRIRDAAGRKQTYAGVEEMPPAVRELYEKAIAERSRGQSTKQDSGPMTSPAPPPPRGAGAKPRPPARSTGGRGELKRRWRLPAPSDMTCELRGDGLRITWRWFGVVPAAAALVLSVFAGWLAFGLATPGLGILQLPGCCGVVALPYIAAAFIVNRTFVDLQGGRIRVHHWPLPWPGYKEVDATSIEQLYCREEVRHSKNGGASYSYRLFALMRTGRSVKLLGGIDNPAHALYIEQELEDRLGIVDRPVKGEYRV